MCSVSGIFEIGNRELSPNDLRAAVLRMNAVLKHRGPDDSGLVDCAWTDFDGSESRSCLGNTRLAIIDTSVAGHQPMTDPETGISISYNGETYNYRELKIEIGDEFGPWHSATDTEVVLRAYRKWGVDGLKKLRGMFAVAICDPLKRQLILARDPFGVKPLYYARSNRSGSSSGQLFIFSSEVRAILATGLVPPTISRAGLASYLTYGSTQAPLTIVDGIQALMPGECQIIRGFDSQLNVESSSIITEYTPPLLTGFSNRVEAATILREKLEQSIRLHLISDVPVGVFLSGGSDSSAVVALINKVGKERIQTFSVVFDDPLLSETQHSRLVAESFQTQHQEIRLTEEQLLQILPRALGSFDQPSMDGVNTYVVSEAVKQAGVKVALSGLGGDELFAGYPSFRRALKLHGCSQLTKRMMRSLGTLVGFSGKQSARASKFCQLARSDLTPNDVYRISRQLFDSRTVSELAGSPFIEENIVSVLLDPINQISQLELKGYMANTLLRDTDNMSMANSLEVRVPFVDIKVAQFAFSVPGRLKLNGEKKHISKPLLAEALTDLLPREILQRRKVGFTLPFARWMQSRLRDSISSALFDPKLAQQIGLNPHSVDEIWTSFLRSPRAIGWSRPWSLYVLARWCEVNDVRC